MEEKDWDHQFQRLVENIDLTDLSDPRVALSLWDINRAVLGMAEASMYLTRWIGQFIQHDEMEFPEDLVSAIRQLITLTDAIADGLTDCDCPECEQCPVCDDGSCEICQENEEESGA